MEMDRVKVDSTVSSSGAVATPGFTGSEFARPSLLGRALGFPAAQQAQQQYQAMLEAAVQEDFSDLEGLGFLQTGGKDVEGRPVVLISARLFPASVVPKDRTLKYLALKLHDVVQHPYSVVWLHTKASYWQNCPSVWWLWKTYESLPCVYRENLVSMHVVHCDLTLWGFTLSTLRWCSEGLSSKINWVSRIEFLWDHVNKASLISQIPDYVKEHDQELEEQPLQDYGLIATKELGMAIPGAPQPM